MKIFRYAEKNVIKLFWGPAKSKDTPHFLDGNRLQTGLERLLKMAVFFIIFLHKKGRIDKMNSPAQQPSKKF